MEAIILKPSSAILLVIHHFFSPLWEFPIERSFILQKRIINSYRYSLYRKLFSADF